MSTQSQGFCSQGAEEKNGQLIVEEALVDSADALGERSFA